MRDFRIKYGLFFLLLLIPVSLSAQKDVRKNVRKGNKAYNAQKFDDAFKFYENAAQKNPSSKEANYNLGNALYRQKEWDKSVEQLNHYLSLEQENTQQMSAAWHNMGNALLQKKELQKSMEAYKMALRLNPEDEESRYNLAVVQKMIQDEEDQSDQGEGEEDKEQDQDQDQQQDQSQQNPQNQDQRAEQPNEPEQMSRSNAQQILQAIEQDERETQEKVQKMQAEERKQQAEDNRRHNKNW